MTAVDDDDQAFLHSFAIHKNVLYTLRASLISPRTLIRCQTYTRSFTRYTTSFVWIKGWDSYTMGSGQGWGVGYKASGARARGEVCELRRDGQSGWRRSVAVLLHPYISSIISLYASRFLKWRPDLFHPPFSNLSTAEQRHARTNTYPDRA